MTPRKRKAEPKVCEMCGTRLRPPRTTCPRGPQCARDAADHDALLERMQKSPSPAV